MAKRDDEFEGRDTVTLTLDDDSELEEVQYTLCLRP